MNWTMNWHSGTCTCGAHCIDVEEYMWLIHVQKGSEVTRLMSEYISPG